MNSDLNLNLSSEEKAAIKDYVENQAYVENLEICEAIKKRTTFHALDDFFKEIAESVNAKNYKPTGFEKLDELLDGGLFEGLYILGAISSTGKTTFLLQICDYLARKGEAVLFFSFEQSKFELISKSLSRQLFELVKREKKSDKLLKTNREITTGRKWVDYSEEERKFIQRAKNKYTIYSKDIYIYERYYDQDLEIGVKEVRAIIDEYVKFMGKKPIVIIDYLQIMKPTDYRLTDKQNTDTNVSELRKISRDHKIPIIAISSFNRENYSKPVSMASFKESGAIEYSSDVLLALQYRNIKDSDFNLEDEIKKDVRELELKILKNRNGNIGEVDLDFHRKYNFFEEL